MDPLEREHLRRKMATRMGSFLESASFVSCVSSHYYGEPQFCELCQNTHGHDILIIKNRSHKKMKVAASCIREMVRFKVVEVEDLARWLDKLGQLRIEYDRRKEIEMVEREEERKRLEKKVIVRKRHQEVI